MLVPEYGESEVTLPEYIYRYRPSKTRYLEDEVSKTLERRIWLSEPKYLNDPFDCNPSITESTIKELSDIIKTYGFRRYKADLAERMSSAAGRDIKRERRWKRISQTPATMAKFEYEITKLNTRYYALQRAKVACLSTRHDSILMWSHYSTNHSGYCVKYRYRWGSAETSPLRVRYVDNRSNLSMIDLVIFSSRHLREFAMEENDEYRIISALFYEKASEWSYENEWRIVLPDGGKAGYRYIPELEPVGVYLGANATPEVKDVIRGRCQSIEVTDLQIDSGSYRLISKPQRAIML